jgi:hypothetical protein
MSYVDKLDLLLEAEGPSRRDFNKSVAASAASSNFIPNLTGGVSNVAFTAIKDVIPSASKLLAAVDAYLKVNGSDKYKFFSKFGKDRISKVFHWCMSGCDDLSYDEAVEKEPLAKYFYYQNTHFYQIPKEHVKDSLWGFAKSESETEEHAFYEIFLADEKWYGAGNIISSGLRSGDLNFKFFANYFGGFGKFFKIFSDSMPLEDGPDFLSNQMYMLDLVKQKAPTLYDSLGLKIDLSEYKRLDNKISVDERYDYDTIKDSPILRDFDKMNIDILSQLKEKGLIGDKHIGLVKDIIQKLKSKVGKQGRIDKLKETEERIKAPRREKKFDDEAMSRWEDEGGALGPLDEAIRRLLNVIY